MNSFRTRGGPIVDQIAFYLWYFFCQQAIAVMTTLMAIRSCISKL
jgi:hypothetical protein